MIVGGVMLSKNMTGDQLIQAHASIVDSTERGTPQREAAMKSFVSGLKKAGVSASTFEEGTGANVKMKRWLKSYG